MLNTDKSALECDLAETYHIYDYRALPLSKVALFSSGLRNDSRIKLKMSKSEYSFDTLLLAGIYDNLSTLIWFQTEDGRKGVNRPESVYARLAHIEKPKEGKDIMVFRNGEEFMKYWNRNKKKAVKEQ